MPSIKTQGSHLYFIDPTESDFPVRRMECPTGISGLGGPADSIDETCLEDIDAVSSPGIRRPAGITVPYVLKDGDTPGQAALEAIDDAQLTIGWFAALSNGSGVPTKDSEQENLVGDGSRDGYAFRGYIAEITVDIAANEVVRGTMTIQRVGGKTRYRKTA
jgi:hypothetical protein